MVNCHCEKRSDEAISSSEAKHVMRLLRCARNDKGRHGVLLLAQMMGHSSCPSRKHQRQPFLQLPCEQVDPEKNQINLTVRACLRSECVPCDFPETSYIRL
jgi:hypothetical protein